MNILEKLLGNDYPKLGSEIFADGNKTEDRLSEPNVIKAIGLDCKPFICTDDESKEEAQAYA